LEPNARRYNWATLFLEEINTGTCSSRLRESQKYRQYTKLMNPVGRCPAKAEKYRPDFSSERVHHINKPETV
jgi:hypothetical protein